MDSCYLLSQHLADNDGELQWPLQDPFLEEHDEGFHLPDSPWTYGNGSYNPTLQPASYQTRRRRGFQEHSRNPETSSLPPYHPDYKTDDVVISDHSLSDDDQEYYVQKDGPSHANRLKIRQGSEGFEVKPVNREMMLRRYIEEQTQQEGRYQIYVPEAESGDEHDIDEDDLPYVGPAISAAS